MNRIELRGIVGSVKTQTVSGNKMSRFSVATSRAYKDKEGNAVIETTWHNVVAWESDRTKDLDLLRTGSKVFVAGRIRSQKFTGSDGVERTSFEVVASKVSILDTEDLSYEM